MDDRMKIPFHKQQQQLEVLRDHVVGGGETKRGTLMDFTILAKEIPPSRSLNPLCQLLMTTHLQMWNFLPGAPADSSSNGF